MATGLYSHGRTPNGNRLADPNDPAVRAGLRRACPDCKQPEGEWCIGIAENSPTKGRKRTRLHFGRCYFAAYDALGRQVVKP